MSSDTPPAGNPPHQPLAGRYEGIARVLQGALVVVVGLSLAAVLLPRDLATASGTAVVVLLIAIPVLRVGWLLTRWTRRRDRRFAAAAVVLLGLLALAISL